MNYHVLKISNEIELSAILEDDADAIARHIHDKEIYQNTLQVPHPYTLQNAFDFIQAVHHFEKIHQKQKDWAIRYHGELVGGIGLLYNFGVDSHRSEFGYWLAKGLRRKGIMKDIINIFSSFCLKEIGLIRLEAHVFVSNLASQQVLLKNGFKREAFIEAAYLKDGAIIDAYLFSKIA